MTIPPLGIYLPPSGPPEPPAGATAARPTFLRRLAVAIADVFADAPGTRMPLARGEERDAYEARLQADLERALARAIGEDPGPYLIGTHDELAEIGLRPNDPSVPPYAALFADGVRIYLNTRSLDAERALHWELVLEGDRWEVSQ